MTEITNLLSQVFQQHGLVGLVIGFLILGPGFTYLRTRTIRVQAEAKAQALVNEFARQERQRADRLETQFNVTLRKLDRAEEAVAQLRLKLAESQNQLEALSRLRRQLRKLTRRVRELEEIVETKNAENAELRRVIAEREIGVEHDQEPTEAPETEAL